MPELSVAWTIFPLCVILRQINLYTAWKQMRGGEDRIFLGLLSFSCYTLFWVTPLAETKSPESTVCRSGQTNVLTCLFNICDEFSCLLKSKIVKTIILHFFFFLQLVHFPLLLSITIFFLLIWCYLQVSSVSVFISTMSYVFFAT